MTENLVNVGASTSTTTTTNVLIFNVSSRQADNFNIYIYISFSKSARNLPLPSCLLLSLLGGLYQTDQMKKQSKAFLSVEMFFFN